MEFFYNASPEVEEKIKALFAELHEVCGANNLPLVVAVGMHGNDNGIAIAMSARLDSSKNCAPNHMIAACEIMKMGDVPDDVVEALIAKNSSQEECSCPTCQARRATLEKPAIVTH